MSMRQPASAPPTGSRRPKPYPKGSPVTDIPSFSPTKIILADIPTVSPGTASPETHIPTPGPSLISSNGRPSSFPTPFPHEEVPRSISPSPLLLPSGPPALAFPTFFPTSIRSVVTSKPSSSTPSIPTVGMPTDNSQAPIEINDICATIDGVYGSLGGKPEIISFGYELETMPLSIDGFEALSKNLEHTFIDYILPVLFPTKCMGLARRLDVSFRRHLSEIVGVSARPDDVPFPDTSCSSEDLQAPDNFCIVMKGQISLFVRSGEFELEREKGRVEEALQRGMDDGIFADSDDDVVRVSYVGMEAFSNDDRGDKADPIFEPNSGKIGGGIVAVVVLVAASSLLIGALIAYRQHKKRQIANGLVLVGTGTSGDTEDTLVLDRAGDDKGNAFKDAEVSDIQSEQFSVYIDDKPISVVPDTDKEFSGSEANDVGKLDPVETNGLGDEPTNDLRSPTDESVYLTEEEPDLASPKTECSDNHFL